MTVNRTKGLFAWEFAISKAKCKFTAPNYLVTVPCIWSMLPRTYHALNVQEVAIAQGACTEFPPSANCLW